MTLHVPKILGIPMCMALSATVHATYPLGLLWLHCIPSTVLDGHPMS